MDGFKLYSQLRKVDPDIVLNSKQEALFLTASKKHLDTRWRKISQGSISIKPIHIQDLVKEANLRLKLSVE